MFKRSWPADSAVRKIKISSTQRRNCASNNHSLSIVHGHVYDLEFIFGANVVRGFKVQELRLGIYIRF